MSLSASLNIGRTALTASQIGLQTTGENLANAATAGYNRKEVSLAARKGHVDGAGIYRGSGVAVADISRRIDEAITSRLRDAVSQENGAGVTRDLLLRIESLVAGTKTTGLNRTIGAFFDAFSSLANNVTATAPRAVAIQAGAAVAADLKRVRADVLDLRDQVGDQLQVGVRRANELLGELETLNKSVLRSELGGTENASLRDARDGLLRELSTLMEVSVTEHDNGIVDVAVGQVSILQGNRNRGVRLVEVSDGEKISYEIRTSDDKSEQVRPAEGLIGALANLRTGAIDDTIAEVDALAAAIIKEVNSLHAAGQPFPGLTDTTATASFNAAEQKLALNHPNNAAAAGLPYAPKSGRIVLKVTAPNKSVQTHTIKIDLDGINGTGAASTANDTTLQGLQNALQAVPGLNAKIDASGKLRVYADSGYSYGFAEDTSGVLGAIGLNGFFAGSDAGDIQVRKSLQDNPATLVVGKEKGGNETALAIAKLREKKVPGLGGATIQDSWRTAVGAVAAGAAAGKTAASAATAVRAGLDAQRTAVSGVSVDEETLNLVTYQRQYQAAARYINVVDEMMQTLISLV